MEAWQPPFSLPTGFWIAGPRDKRGHGAIKVENGENLDSVAKLVNWSGAPLWEVYIRANEKTEVDGIAPGSYRILFALGEDWDSTSQKFRHRKFFYEGGNRLDFTEAELPDGTIDYSVEEVTLQPVPNGNMQRFGITEEQFEKGDPGAVARR